MNRNHPSAPDGDTQSTIRITKKTEDDNTTIIINSVFAPSVNLIDALEKISLMQLKFTE